MCKKLRELRAIKYADDIVFIKDSPIITYMYHLYKNIRVRDIITTNKKYEINPTLNVFFFPYL